MAVTVAGGTDTNARESERVETSSPEAQTVCRPDDLQREDHGLSTPINVEALPGANGLRITGELDASNALEVTQHLDERLRDPGDLTVDLSGLDFIDSAGMNVLINAARRIEGRGRMTIRCRQDGPVRRVMDLMGVVEVLHHVDLEETPETPGAEGGAA
jgi:stage II sporulation protein AA (anti-sigma F factor antagonist)